MKNYNIEGNIDFFNELYKSEILLNETEDHHDVCLITCEPLIEKFVILKCGHKFNYIPLYKDILNHKRKFNYMEGNIGHLTQNQIRCPYCRFKQDGVLPYYPDLGLDKIVGVNVLNIYDANVSKLKRCEYLIPNPNYIPDTTNTELVGDIIGNNLLDTNLYNCKYFKCNHYGSLLKDINKSSENNPDKYYCYTHKNLIIKKQKNDLLEKKKEEKLKLKEEKLKLKEELKLKLKEEKIKIKAAKQNIVLGTSIIMSDKESVPISELCKEIIKFGLNKGNQCSCKIFKNDDNKLLCKRHYNIYKNKIINLNN
jgi:hypothetical protein